MKICKMRAWARKTIGSAAIGSSVPTYLFLYFTLMPLLPRIHGWAIRLDRVELALCNSDNQPQGIQLDA